MVDYGDVAVTHLKVIDAGGQASATLCNVIIITVFIFDHLYLYSSPLDKLVEEEDDLQCVSAILNESVSDVLLKVTRILLFLYIVLVSCYMSVIRMKSYKPLLYMMRYTSRWFI